MQTTEKPEHQHRDLLRSIGTTREVADIVKQKSGRVISPQVIGVWRYRGIPWKWRPLMTEICAERSISVPDGFVMVGGMS